MRDVWAAGLTISGEKSAIVSSWNYYCWNGALLVSVRRLASIETDCLVHGDADPLTWGESILLRGLLALRCA